LGDNGWQANGWQAMRALPEDQQVPLRSDINFDWETADDEASEQ